MGEGRVREKESPMPNTDSKTYLVNDQPTERDALDFTPYVETLADIIQTGNTPLTIGVLRRMGIGQDFADVDGEESTAR